MRNFFEQVHGNHGGVDMTIKIIKILFKCIIKENTVF